MDYKTITKSTTMKEAEEILNSNGIKTPFGWEIAIGMLLEGHDHIEIEGYGSSANFILVD